MSDDLPHLRQINSISVDSLCDRADAIPIAENRMVRLETQAFRESRTPHDATRLANVLAYRRAEHESIDALVRDLDTEAERCAGVVPANRHSTRIPHRGKD